MTPRDDLLRALPSVGSVLDGPAGKDLASRFGREIAARAVREAVEEFRLEISSGQRSEAVSGEEVGSLALKKAHAFSTVRLRRVVNATGVVIHTNLGRAPLAEAAREALVGIARGYSSLEYDLETGSRGERLAEVSRLYALLAGSEDAAVVNNNAGAVFLILKALAEGGEVVVSRGQLIEIGGSFRLPEIMLAAGVRMVEVGTTNRTRISDYERSVTSETRLFFLAHPSNYRVVGFTEEVGLEELVRLGRKAGVAVVHDLGSGCLLEMRDEPLVQRSVRAGADLVSSSGDKLLGGPQSGLIAGCRDLVGRLRSHPVYRALRPGKLTIAALEATLRLYLRGERVPVLRMLFADEGELKGRAEALARRLERACPGARAEVVRQEGRAGGGSLPEEPLQGWAVSVEVRGLSSSELARALRRAEVPVIAIVRKGRVILDVRTLLEGEEEAIEEAFRGAGAGPRGQ